MDNERKIYQFKTINPIIALIAIGLFVIGLFWITKGLIVILARLAPFILLGAVIANYRVVLGYGKWLIETLSRNPAFGVIAIIFSIIAFPLVSFYLLLKAINSRRSQSQNSSYKKKDEDFVPYEEIEDDFLDLSEVKAKKEELNNQYDEILKK